MQPTQKLTFADDDLFAYDYLWDKKAVITDQDFKATYRLKVPEKEKNQTNMWMKGSPGREIFLVKAPAITAFKGSPMLPTEISNLPQLTIVAHQTGETWTKPFAAIYEPSSNS